MHTTSPKIWRRAKEYRENIGKIGVVESFTVIHAAPSGFDRYAPYPVAIAKFGNKKMIGQLTDYKGKDISVGMRVRVVLRRSRREDARDVIEYILKFKPTP